MVRAEFRDAKLNFRRSLFASRSGTMLLAFNFSGFGASSRREVDSHAHDKEHSSCRHIRRQVIGPENRPLALLVYSPLVTASYRAQRENVFLSGQR